MQASRTGIALIAVLNDKVESMTRTTMFEGLTLFIRSSSVAEVGTTPSVQLARSEGPCDNHGNMSTCRKLRRSFRTQN